MYFYCQSSKLNEIKLRVKGLLMSHPKGCMICPHLAHHPPREWGAAAAQHWESLGDVTSPIPTINTLAEQGDDGYYYHSLRYDPAVDQTNKQPVYQRTSQQPRPSV